MNYLIEFDSLNMQKNLNFDTFSLICALFAALYVPYKVPNFGYFILFVQITSYCYEL